MQKTDPKFLIFTVAKWNFRSNKWGVGVGDEISGGGTLIRRFLSVGLLVTEETLIFKLQLNPTAVRNITLKV